MHLYFALTPTLKRGERGGSAGVATAQSDDRGSAGGALDGALDDAQNGARFEREGVA